jgi:ABC-type glycerol-3-phosphate transport system permease component
LAIYLSLIVLAVLVMTPFYWMTKAALTAPNDLFKLPPPLLPTFTLENFATLADQVPLGATCGIRSPLRR